MYIFCINYNLNRAVLEIMKIIFFFTKDLTSYVAGCVGIVFIFSLSLAEWTKYFIFFNFISSCVKW